MKILIIGVGLIGGSIGLNLKRNFVGKYQIYGLDKNEANLTYAIKHNIIDHKIKFSDNRQIFDIILLATPLSTYENILKNISNFTDQNTVITDIGSVKFGLCNILKKFPEYNFVPAHPIAGTEKSGPQQSVVDLFQNKKLIIANDYSSLNHKNLIVNLWQDLGVKIIEMDAREHDKIYADVSHLVQLICSIFTYYLYENYDSNYIKNLWQKSIYFQKFIRLAGSNAKMWRDIFYFNKENILNSIKNFKNNIKKINNQQILEAKDFRNSFIDDNIEENLSEKWEFEDLTLKNLMEKISATLLLIAKKHDTEFITGIGLISMSKYLEIYDEDFSEDKIDDRFLQILDNFYSLLEENKEEEILELLTKIRNFYQQKIL